MQNNIFTHFYLMEHGYRYCIKNNSDKNINFLWSNIALIPKNGPKLTPFGQNMANFGDFLCYLQHFTTKK